VRGPGEFLVRKAAMGMRPRVKGPTLAIHGIVFFEAAEI
jgi:hypothetical protein